MGSAEVPGSPAVWMAPRANGPVRAVIAVPGSKSLTNRALILAALASEPTTIRGALLARDSELMMRGLRALGATVSVEAAEAGASVVVQPPREFDGGIAIDCGLAGTVMRFLPPVAAMAGGPVDFDGDARARQRPLAPLAQALRQLGVPVTGDALPLRVHAHGRVAGGPEVTIDSSASSQFASGLLLAAARFEHGIDLRHVGAALPSLPHVDMTVAMLAERGVHVSADTANLRRCRWQVAPGPIAGGTMQIEPDLSNAGPFLAAAMVTAGDVTIRDWPRPGSSTQAGDRLRDIFERMGAQVDVFDDGLRLRGPERVGGIELDMSEVGELLPTVAAVAAVASAPSRLTGLAHVRGHETDRLAALADALRRLGVDAIEEPDSLVITPGRLRADAEPVLLPSHADHRMATFAAIVGLRTPVLLDDISATSKTMPTFPELWAQAITEGLDDAGAAR